MTRLIVAALFAATLAGCGAAPAIAPAVQAPVAMEAQAAVKTSIKKAAVEAVTAELTKLKIKPTSVKATTVELESTVLGSFAKRYVATVQVKATNPFGAEERTYEVTGMYLSDNKEKPVTVDDVTLTRQTR
jgi:hypothetical protein